MKTYSVTLAEDIPHYAFTRIEAENDDAAIAAAKALDRDAFVYQPDWTNAVCRRIVGIEDEHGGAVAPTIALDNCFLRHGGPADERLCEIAPRLVEALRIIAATPLWGESLPDGDLKTDFIETGQYDAADHFQPSGDTESTQLRDAVECARAAIALLEGGAP